MSFAKAVANAKRNPDITWETTPSPARRQRTRSSDRAVVSRWRNERQFMAAVIDHCDALAGVNPLYARVYHVSNENAHRNPGVRAGVPDLALDAARYDPDAGRGYHGWRCELKIGNNTLSDAQHAWCAHLTDEDYYIITVWESVDDALANLAWYLALPRWPAS